MTFWSRTASHLEEEAPCTSVTVTRRFQDLGCAAFSKSSPLFFTTRQPVVRWMSNHSFAVTEYWRGWLASPASGSTACTQGVSSSFRTAFSFTYSAEGSVSKTGASFTSSTSTVSTLITVCTDASAMAVASTEKGMTNLPVVS